VNSNYLQHFVNADHVFAAMDVLYNKKKTYLLQTIESGKASG
jgi:hypothetical protein